MRYKYHRRNNIYKKLFYILFIIILILLFLILYFGEFDIEEEKSKILVDDTSELSTELPDKPLSMPPSYDEGTTPSVLP